MPACRRFPFGESIVVLDITGHHAPVEATQLQFDPDAVGTCGLRLPQRAIAIEVGNLAVAPRLERFRDGAGTQERTRVAGIEDLAICIVDRDFRPRAVCATNFRFPDPAVAFDVSYLGLAGRLQPLRDLRSAVRVGAAR